MLLLLAAHGAAIDRELALTLSGALRGGILLGRLRGAICKNVDVLEARASIEEHDGVGRL
jgi:hypothetical protein